MRNIFISATSSDLREERRQVMELILALGFHPVVQEAFEAQSNSVTVSAMLERKMRACDAVIHLCGFYFGTGPDSAESEPRRSWAQLEYLLARETGKPVFVGLADENTYRSVCPSQSPEDATLQCKHYERLRGGTGLYYPFRSITDIKHAISSFLISLGPPSPRAAGVNDNLHQLPPLTPHFTNRTNELGLLLETVRGQVSDDPNSGAPCIIGLRGMPGIGKTALALRLAYNLTDQFPDAQLFIDMHGYGSNPRPLTEALAHCIRSFRPEGTVQDNTEQLRSAYLGLLRGRRALLVFDNVAPSPDLYLLLPPTGCLLILTSREWLELEGLNLFRLETLERHDSVSLLRRLSPKVKEESIEVLDALAARSGDVAEALRVNSGTLNKNAFLSAHALVQQLQQQGRQLAPLEASLKVSYEHLDSNLRAAWCRLAIFQGDFPSDAAAAVWGVTPSEATGPLGGLEAASLIQPPSPNGRVRLHDLVRMFADTKLKERDRNSAEENYARYCISALAGMNTQFLEGGEATLSALQRFDAERPNVEAIIEKLALRSSSESQPFSASRLFSAVVAAWPHLLELRISRPRRIAWLRGALAAARVTGECSEQAWHLAFLGLAQIDMGQAPDGRLSLDAALTLARELRDKRLEAAAASFLGISHQVQGDLVTAHGLHERALEFHRLLGDRRGEANDLNNLGLTSDGPLDTQLTYFENAKQLAREIQNRRAEAFALGYMAKAYHRNGMSTEAVACGIQAVALRREIGDRQFEIDDLETLVNAAFAAKLENGMEPFVERLIDLYRQTETPPSKEFVATCVLAEMNCQAGDLERAVQTARSLRLRIRSTDELEVALLSALQRTADRLLQAAQGTNSSGSTRSDIATGIEAAQEARLLYQRLSLEIGEADALFAIGYGNATAGSFQKSREEICNAIDAYQRCVLVRTKLGDTPGEAAAMGNLGDAWQQLGAWKKAMAFSRMALKLRRKSNDLAGEGLDLANLAINSHNLGHRNRAILLAKRSLPLLEKTGSVHTNTVRSLLDAWLGQPQFTQTNVAQSGPQPTT